jgi:hypothetical protein
MKYVKLFENFLLEGANTNLEMKSIFKSLVNELKKMGLKVKFEYKRFEKGEFDKFIPSKNFYDQGQDDVYFVMNDDDPSKGYAFMKLFFNWSIDKEKSKTYTQNVKKIVESKFESQLQVDTITSTFGEVGLIIKPKSVNKSKMELSMDANKFMGLKRSPVENEVSYLVGSGWEYISDRIEKNREFLLIKIDDSSKTVEINKGLMTELSRSNKKDKLVNIAKEFAKKNGYKYKSISNSFD